MRHYEVIIVESKNLDRNVKVYISLPKSYKKTEEHYPVLYMNDGNVLFNDFEEVSNDWGMMDQFMNQDDKTEIIMVGIASGNTRNDELFPFVIERKDKDPIGGKTDLYLGFIIDELKPHIDNMYRTKTEAEHTGFIGVSVGGAAVLYAASKYTEYFSRFAFVSSCHYPVHKKLLKHTEQSTFDGVIKMYSDVGTEEHNDERVKNNYLKSNKEMYEVLRKKLKPYSCLFQIIEGSKHEFEYWNKRFPEIIEFMFGDWYE